MHPKRISFHAQHSPMGALASFTCGAHNQAGGMGLELDAPYQGDITVGYFDAQGVLHSLPFFENSGGSESERYVEGKEGTAGRLRTIQNLSREYYWASDKFISPRVSLEVITPFSSIPDPDSACNDKLAYACCPVVHLRIHFNNPGTEKFRGVFALGIDKRWSSISQQSSSKLKGAVSQGSIGFATDHPEASTFFDFDVISALNRRHRTPEFLLGPTAGLEIDVAAGEQKTLDVALGFYREGRATYNRRMEYYYTRHFHSLLDALEFATEKREDYLLEAISRDQELSRCNLSAEQKFLIAHATRSYYGSSQWLWDGKKSVWVVHEGEYMMMNTFDLSVDMLFYELRQNPWTVRNVLEQFVESYAYEDQVFSPTEPEKRYPGGITFTHDMGVMNHWSPEGYSAYEVSGLDRECFSYMSCEQLCNWIICASLYYSKTSDSQFVRAHINIFRSCLDSLLNRDNPDPMLRNGLMSFDSSRTQGGGEITTYDSLDHSLGQARHNIYLGGKMWASGVLLAEVFRQFDHPILSREAEASAQRTARSLSAAFDNDLGYIPAVLEAENTSAIIPAIEALVYPYVAHLKVTTRMDGPYGEYISTLKRHTENILKPGLCLYESGAWKLSSTADNSWPSKIAICQYVASEILGLNISKISPDADKAHALWQQQGAWTRAFCDQFKSGQAIGSLYYPRGVSNILWMS